MKKSEPFENVKNQIGYCGIWCGSCVVGNGVLRILTERYEEIIQNYGLEGWVPKDFDFKEFSKGLESIQNIPLCPGCLKGGGRESCEMEDCCSNKHLSDCTECDDPGECAHQSILEKMRTGARQAGLFVKTENVDRQALIEKWITQIESRWPSNILFFNRKSEDEIFLKTIIPSRKATNKYLRG